MTDLDVAVVGAGIAGLATAHALVRAGRRVQVFEAAGHVGGRMATVRRDGYLVDAGAEMIPTRGYPATWRLVRQLGLGPADAPRVPGALALWRDAGYREERYLAVALTGWPRYAGYQDPAVLPLYEELVVTGAWWDYVDEVAIQRIGPILRGHREALTPVIRAWSTDADPWKRRTAVICQVKAKGDTDLALLADCIAANAADRDFFLRKAIGWALRDYAWHDPRWVRGYVAAHPELSALSRREALKNLR